MLKRTNLSLLFILVFVIITGCSQITNQDDALEASGTIQAERVTITSQLSGKVVEIYVEQGQPVKLGDPLFRLDDSFYKSQRDQAVAAYNSALSNIELAQIAVSEAGLALSTSEAELSAAQADIDLAYDSLSASELQKEIAEINLEMVQLQHEQTERQLHQSEQQSRLTAWSSVASPEFELPSWYYQKDERISAVLSLVETTGLDYEDEQDHLNELRLDPQYQEIFDAEERLVKARSEFLVAQELRDRRIDENREIDDFIQTLYDSAESELESAQEQYDRVATDEQESDIWEARGRLAASTERYQIALDQYYSLLTGEESFTFRTSQLSVSQADKALAQAEIQIDQAQQTIVKAESALVITQINQRQKTIQFDKAETSLKAAQNLAEESEKAIDSIDLQIEKLTIHSPIDGTVMTESIAVGEILQPGMPAMLIADLQKLEVTVYLPENEYGSISLNDSVEISANSFQDQVFSGTVIYISDEAEYTPRNTQTEEDRATTVYAVKVKIKTGIDQFKPGMPVDVVFSRN